jgi:hypothetical protein
MGSGVVETKVWTADKQPVALLMKNDWIVQVIPQHTIKAILVLATRKIPVVIGRQELRCHFLLRR